LGEELYARKNAKLTKRALSRLDFGGPRLRRKGKKVRNKNGKREGSRSRKGLRGKVSEGGRRRFRTDRKRTTGRKAKGMQRHSALRPILLFLKGQKEALH